MAFSQCNFAFSESKTALALPCLNLPLGAQWGDALCPEAPCLTCVCEYVQTHARQPVALA